MRRITEGEVAAPIRRRIRTQFGESLERPTTGRFGEGPTQTQARQEAEAVRDPNYPEAYAGREAEARLAPYVLGAEAYATRPTSGTAGKAEEDAARYIGVNLPRLGAIAKQINILGGPAGVITGAIRRGVTGPTQVDELAREFNGIHGALALNLAARFNR
ncbi:MAG: hypothetical protein ACREJC_00115, partial [Tepidisphaeraceae bacterium]